MVENEIVTPEQPLWSCSIATSNKEDLSGLGEGNPW